MFHKNESTLDRAVRGVAGAGLLVAAVASLGLGSGGALGVVFGAVGAILLATAITGFCPLYRLLGVATCRGC
jgi:uncharacterized membrane protein